MVGPHPMAQVVRGYRPLRELVPAHWKSGFAGAEDGARLHYTRTGGQKPALLLLHGVQANGLTWLRTAKALEANYDVVMPDFRGHGESARIPAEGISAELLVSDTTGLIRALELDRPFVVGHSMGADIAGRLAAAHPMRVVALVDPALRNFAAAMPKTSDGPPPWIKPILETMQALRTQSHAERMVTGLRLLLPGTAVWEEADYVSYIDAQAQFDPRIFDHVVSLGYLFESPEVISKITCPILLLTARPMMPGTDIQPGVAAFEKNWREGQHIHFEDSGHAIMFEQFERFLNVLRRFLNEH